MRSLLQRVPAVLLSTAAATALCGGCVYYATPHPTLTYPPARPEASVDGTPDPAAPVANGISIVVLPFADRRSDPQSVGTVRNDYGIKMAPVRAVNSVPAWIQDALVLELRNAGFSVSTATTAPDSSLALGGEILNVYVDDWLMSGAEVSLAIRVTEDGRELLSGTYVGKHAGQVLVLATLAHYTQSLALALADALGQVVPDVEIAAGAK